MSMLSAVRVFAKSNSSSILTGFAITGVITTGIFAGKASIKAEKVLELMEENAVLWDGGKEITRKEKLKTVIPIFMPAIISGLATIMCICATHSIDMQRQMALMSAYSMSEHAMKSMEEKLGDKKVQKIKESIFEDDVKKNPPNPETIKDTGKGKTKFRDSIFGGDIYSDIEYVKSVFNKYNDILNKGGEFYINDLRWDLGFDQIDMGSIMGYDDGQLDARLVSVNYVDKDIQDVTDEEMDNIFYISYNRPKQMLREWG